MAAVNQDQIEVPSVLDLSLDQAKARLQPSLSAVSVDATGRGRTQIVDSNWRVVQQSPVAGIRVQKGSAITLQVIKPGEAVGTPTPTPAVTPAGVAAIPPLPATSNPVITRPRSQATAVQPAPQPASTSRPADPPPANPAPNNPPPANPAPAPVEPAAADTVYANCAQARAAGAAPLRSGQPGYSTRLDRDGDGIACE